MPEHKVRQLKSLMEIYPHDQLLNAYITSGSPYSEVAQQYLNSGTSATSVLGMLFNAAQDSRALDPPGGEYKYEEGVAPGIEYGRIMEQMESALKQFESGAAPGVEHLTAPLDSAERFEEIRQGLREDLQNSKEGVSQGLFGRLKGFVQEKTLEDQMKKELGDPNRAGYTEYTEAMKQVGEHVTQPIVKEVKKELADRLRWDGTTIEKHVRARLEAAKTVREAPEFYEQPLFGSDPKNQQMINQLHELGEHGLLPPASEYSEEFINLITNDPSMAKYLFLLSDYGSRGSASGDITWVTDEEARAHPWTGAIIQSGADVLDKFFIEEFESPEYWHWYALAWLGGKIVFGPGMKQIAESGAPIIGKAAQKGYKVLNWDVGTAFHNYLHKHYDSKLVSKMLAKKAEIPLSAVSNFMRGAIDEDPYLKKNDIMVSVLRRMEREKPKYFQQLLDFMRKNADNLDDVTYQVNVPRFQVKNLVPAAKHKGLKAPHQGVLEVVAKNEGDDTAGVVASLWDKGIDTLESSANANQIRIALDPPTSEAIDELARGPFGFIRDSVDDVYELVINRNKAAEALKYIKSMRQHSNPVYVTKPMQAFHRQLDDMYERGWISEDDLARVREGLIPPEPPVVEFPSTWAIPQAAVPQGDVGTALPPVGVAQLPEAAATPSLSPTAREAYKKPLEKWLLERKLPRDLRIVQSHPARAAEWDAVRDSQIRHYLRQLGKVVKKYAPQNADDFDNAMKQYISGTRFQTRGEWDRFVQLSHQQFSGAKWYDEMAMLGLDDPDEAAEQFHKIAVRSAVESGKDVPDNVLSDYPDLADLYAKRTPALSIADLENQAYYGDVSPPPPVREAPPLKAPHVETGGSVNVSSLRKLGWTDSQVHKMDPDEAARAIAEALGPDNYRIGTKGNILAVKGAAPGVKASDLVPRPLALRISRMLDDDQMRVLSVLRDDPRGLDPEDILKTLTDASPLISKNIPDNVDRGVLIDTIIEEWQKRVASPNYIRDMVREQTDKQWKNYPARVKERFRKLIDRHSGEAPEFHDESLGAHFAAGKETTTKMYKQKIAAVKHDFREHVARAFPDAELRKTYPQFYDDIRTGLQPIGHRAADEADLTIGAIIGDLNKNERNHLFNILGLRDYIATLSDDIEIPGAWGMDVLQKELDTQMATAGARIQGAMGRYYDIMRVMGEDLVERGRLSPAALRSNYLPHLVLDYTPDWMLDKKYKPSAPSRLQRAYRRYTKERAGSPREIALSETALKTHFATTYADNMMEDWAYQHLEAEDLWNQVIRPGMADDEIKAARAAVFGVDDAGRVKRPRHGQRFDVEGATEPYYGFQFEPGNHYYRADAVNRSALGRAIEDSLLIEPDAAERLASQIDLHTLAEGNMPEALASLIDQAGPRGGSVTRPILAVGRRHKAYVIPETIYKKMMWYKNQAPVHIPGLYELMKFTSLWKNVTLTAAGLPFQMGNAAGDAMNLYRTAPGALGEVRGALRMIRNLNRPIGKPARSIWGRMTKFDRDALEIAMQKDVFGSGFATEFMKVRTITNPVHFYQQYQRLGAIREASLRVAMLRYQLKQYDKFAKFHAPEFAKIVANLDRESGAAFIARNFTVDYEAMPQWYNQIVRGTTFPFMTFWQKNAEHWARYTVADPKGFALKFVAPRVFAHYWNTYQYPDIEAALGGLRRRGHLNLMKWDADGDGVDDYGLTWAMQMPMDMAAQWLGFDRLEEKIFQVRKGWITPEEAAKQQAMDMALGSPRLAAKLAHPILQSIMGTLRNKHPQTGKPLLTANQKKLSSWQQQKYLRKFYLQNIITPFGQYMMQKENQTMDTLEALGVNPTSPTRRWLLQGPFNIARGMGLFVVDLKRGEQQRNFYAKNFALTQEATIWEKLYDEYYTFAEEGGKSYDWETFLSRNKTQTVLSDAGLLGLNMNLERVKQKLQAVPVQLKYWQTRAEKATTKEERQTAIRNIEVLMGVINLKSIGGTPTPARPLMQQRLEQMER